MEDQIAALSAELVSLRAANAVSNTATAEMYYYLTLPIMVLIHVGFLAYEMGASRVKNVLASGIKNILAFAFLIPVFYYIGWFIYWAFPAGITPDAGGFGISGWDYALSVANPAGAVMGPNLTDNSNGVLWATFTLFAATTASILSGAVIERIRLIAFIVLAIFLGGFVWVFVAAWGWHADGWLVSRFGYHDFGAAGVVHTVAGFYALGVLLHLGPRMGKFNSDGTVNTLAPHNMPLTLIGLMTIVVGFWGFLMACVNFPGEPWSWSVTEFTSVYGTPMTLSAIAFNFLMGFAGGIIGAWAVTRDPFWMMSGALGGIISVSAGLDFYWPPMAFVIAFAGGCLLPVAAKLIEALQIDDVVGAVAVHGMLGVWGVLAVGVFASGYPATQGEGVALTSISGQLLGAAVMCLAGFLPGYFLAGLMRLFGMLRVPAQVERLGLDNVKVPSLAYPEGVPGSSGVDV